MGRHRWEVSRESQADRGQGSTREDFASKEIFIAYLRKAVQVVIVVFPSPRISPPSSLRRCRHEALCPILGVLCGSGITEVVEEVKAGIQQAHLARLIDLRSITCDCLDLVAFTDIGGPPGYYKLQKSIYSILSNLPSSSLSRVASESVANP
uniref:Uncharacterized protein n=1 Tax=Steinernema glaseri TaxID=37863 RepID=A0A1I8AH48_9BILA